MENIPEQTPRTPEAIESERARIGKEIIELEHKMTSVHEESGDNSPEDNAQEAQVDITTQALIREQINELRRKDAQLGAELTALQEKAA